MENGFILSVYWTKLSSNLFFTTTDFQNIKISLYSDSGLDIPTADQQSLAIFSSCCHVTPIFFWLVSH